METGAGMEPGFASGATNHWAPRMGSGVANDIRDKPGKEAHKEVLKHSEEKMSLRVQGIVDLAMLKPIH